MPLACRPAGCLVLASGAAQAGRYRTRGRMGRFRNVRQADAARVFIRMGGEDRSTKKNYRMIRMPNGNLISQIRHAGLTEDEFEEVLR